MTNTRNNKLFSSSATLSLIRYENSFSAWRQESVELERHMKWKEEKKQGRNCERKIEKLSATFTIILIARYSSETRAGNYFSQRNPIYHNPHVTTNRKFELYVEIRLLGMRRMKIRQLFERGERKSRNLEADILRIFSLRRSDIKVIS